MASPTNSLLLYGFLFGVTVYYLYYFSFGSRSFQLVNLREVIIAVHKVTYQIVSYDWLSFNLCHAFSFAPSREITEIERGIWHELTKFQLHMTISLKVGC